MLEIKNVSKNYGRKAALRDVSLSLPRGQLVGLFGENGAGKTTLMKCILGFVRYYGTITLDGEPIGRRNISRIAFATSEHSFFPYLSPLGHAQFYADHFPTFNRKRFYVLMDFFELPLSVASRKLSTGQKNQFEAVLALSQGADYILMDEPSAATTSSTARTSTRCCLAYSAKTRLYCCPLTSSRKSAVLLAAPCSYIRAR